MPTIDHHHDGHGLNDIITIGCDERDPNSGGASHDYRLLIEVPGGTLKVGRIQFQHGPRKEPGSTPGVTEAALLAILIDRLEGFQAGPYRCRENAIMLTKLQECLHWTRHRADERARRGVLGKNEV